MSAVISLREAVGADLDTLARFQRGIVAAERPFDPTLSPAAEGYYDLPALIADPAVQLLIASADGVPVGCGFARIDAAKPYLSHPRQAYLGLMFVEPAWRGRGVIGGILAALKSWCVGQGVRELRLEVYDANAAALKAYERAGFAAHMLEMRLEL